MKQQQGSNNHSHKLTKKDINKKKKYTLLKLSLIYSYIPIEGLRELLDSDKLSGIYLIALMIVLVKREREVIKNELADISIDTADDIECSE